MLLYFDRESFNWTGVFLIGLEETGDPDGLTNAWTDLEAAAIGDMIRLNTNDDYASMMAKFLVGLHWVTLHCRRLRYVIKADDDVAVEPVLLRRYLDGQVGLTSRVIYCSNQHYNRVLRRRSFSPRDESLGESDHRYCSGRTVVMNLPTAEDLARASRVVPSHSADDVYVTGDLALAARVSHRSLGFSGAREPEGVDAVILGSHMLAHMESAFDQTTGRRAAWHAAIWKWASSANGDIRAVALRRGLFASAMRTESAIGNMLRREPLRTTHRASS
ncbi:hypothetical protein HPB49_003912 [Dermacentor silvarum]|uniref:Uncharacterized protein n=1 Tax=Dermacentor silvarum TaxID=543639 RepID=A0ACB8C7B0_DERSI|nr:hypothetical protein HPB49_003912 [Dermacentor silvarum]